MHVLYSALNYTQRLLIPSNGKMEEAEVKQRRSPPQRRRFHPYNAPITGRRIPFSIRCAYFKKTVEADSGKITGVTKQLKYWINIRKLSTHEVKKAKELIEWLETRVAPSRTHQELNTLHKILDNPKKRKSK